MFDYSHVFDVVRCWIRSSASRYVGRSDNPGRPNSVVVICPARGTEHSVPSAHVAPPASPSRRFAARARARAPQRLGRRRRVASATTTTTTTWPRCAAHFSAPASKDRGERAGDLKRLLFQGLFTGGALGAVTHSESGQESFFVFFFSRIFPLLSLNLLWPNLESSNLSQSVSCTVLTVMCM